VRKEFREIFFSMGFEEMPTNNFVESSFWNFDALFQPQQHPARDAHDTFFMSGAFPPISPVRHVHQARTTQRRAARELTRERNCG
jgi:phenylalanyl-tRNA synthetase alpha subunit